MFKPLTSGVSRDNFRKILPRFLQNVGKIFLNAGAEGAEGGKGKSAALVCEELLGFGVSWAEFEIFMQGVLSARCIAEFLC